MSAWQAYLDEGAAGLPPAARARLKTLFASECPFDLTGDELNLHYVMSLCIRVTCHRVIDGRLRLYTERDEAGMLMKGGHIPLCGHPFTWFAVTATRAGRLGGSWAAADALADMLAAHPRSAFLHALRGLALLPVRRYQDAIAEFGRALALGGPDARVLAWRGSAYVQLTDLSRALADLDASVRSGGGAWAHAWRAEVLWLRGRKAEARADLRRALELSPDSAALHVLGARRGRESLLDRAEDLAPDLLWVHALRGHILQWRGDYAGAERAFKTMTEVHTHRWSFARLAGARLRRGDEAGAERAWRRGLRDEEDAKWVLGRLPPLVRCTLYSGAGEDCELGVQDVKDLTAEIARRPRHGWSRAVRASLVGHQLWKAEELRRASFERKEPRLTALWAQEMVSRSPAAALALLDDALRREPRNPWLTSLRARALWSLGRPREASAACDRALKIYPMDLDANCLKGIALLSSARGPGAVRRALAVMGAGLTIYANHTRVLLARREGHMRLGRWRSALEDMAAAARDDAALTWADAADRSRDAGRALRELERLTKAMPREAEAWAWRAKALLDLGRVPAAERALARALSLDPRCAWALTWRGELEHGRGRLARAERSLDAAILADPYLGRAYGARAAVRAARGRHGPAAADIDVYLQLIRTDRGGLAFRARQRRLQGDPRASVRELDAYLTLNPYCHWGFYERALSRRAGGEFEGALEDLAANRALAEWPFNAGASPDWTVVPARREIGEAADGSGAWAAALRLYLGDPAGALETASAAKREFWAGVVSAAARLALGEPAAARALLAPLLVRRPKAAWPRLLRAQAALAEGDAHACLADLKRVEGAWRPHAALLRAKALASLGRWKEALAGLDAELRGLPGPHAETVFVYRARLKRLAGRAREAAEDLARYALVDGAPWPGWSRYERGLALASLGDPASAARLKEALELGVDREGPLGPALLPLANFEPEADFRALAEAGKPLGRALLRGAGA